MPQETQASGYERRLVAVLCVAYGLTFFDNASVSYLVPFIKPALKLDNTQVGMLFAGFALTNGVAAYATGPLIDAIGRPKRFLIVTMVAFSLCSVLSGLATSFATLLAARLLMGLLEGTPLPIVQSIISMESSPSHRGRNMGIVQSLGSSILGLFIAPLILVKLATSYGWHVGFFVVILPSLICTGIVARLVREPAKAAVFSRAENTVGRRGRSNLKEVLQHRNTWICALAFALIIAFLNIGFAFLPLFYVNVKHFSAPQMSFLMSAIGISLAVSGVVAPAVSDRVGRKPVMIIASSLGVVAPLAAIFYDGSIGVLALFVVIGWTLTGVASLAAATIPSETVDERSQATAIGLIIAFGTFVGGLAAPSIAGWSADRWGLESAVLLEAGCAAAAAIACLFLRETAYGVVNRGPTRLSPANKL
jgi:MFS family permease